MSTAERDYFHTLSRKASVVASAALALSRDCRSSDGDRVESPERVRELLNDSYRELKALVEGEKL